MALSDRQIVNPIRLDGVLEIEGGAGALDLGARQIQEGLEAARGVARRVAENLGKCVVSLDVQTDAHPAANFELQGIVSRIAVVGDGVRSEHHRIAEKADRRVESIEVILIRQFTGSALFDQVLDKVIRQCSAREAKLHEGNLVEDRQTLAAWY